MPPESPDPSPDSPEIDEPFVDSLVGFDELLRRGAASQPYGLAGDAGHDTAGAQACLTFLERAFPRGGNDAESPETERIGRFELVRILGQGGFGVVYLARDPRLGRLVALKVPRLNTLGNGTLHSRFLREARAAAALDHPHITPILETGEIGPVCYIASAYCEGADLAQWLKAHAPVAPRLAARIVAALADATHYSHTRGILHRDLKPSNVLLAARNATSGAADDELPFVPRLTDFGLARLAEEGVGETGSAILGTPQYMAPEQAGGRGGEVCAATDVYGLGVILYELLTARPPFLGTAIVEVLDQIRSVDPLPPSRLIRSIPRDLETICLKCLHKEPHGRYVSSGDLRDDLQRFLRGEPIRAKPAAVWERSVKWGRRHPGLLAMIVVSVLALVSLVGGLAFHLAQVEGHLQTAEKLRTKGLEREAKLRFQAYVGEMEAASNDLAAVMPELAHRRLEQFVPSDVDTIDVRGPEWHYLWEQSRTATPALVFRAHRHSVHSVAITGDGQFAVSGDKDGVIKVWDVKTGEVRKSFAAHNDDVRALRLSPDGRYLASGGCFRFIRIWNVSDWSRVAEFDAHDGDVKSIDFSPDSERLVYGGRNGVIRCWDWRHFKELWHAKLGETVYEVRFADAGTTLDSVHEVHDKAILTRWDAASGRILHSEEMGNTGGNLLTIDLSPDSRFIIGGGGSKEITCFETSTHEQWALPVGQAVYSAAFSADGQHVALGTRIGEIYLLKFAAGSFREVTFRRWWADHETVLDLKFSPDGKLLFSSCVDGTVQVWNLDDLPAEQFSYFSETRGANADTHCRAIVADARRIVTAGEFGGHGWVRVSRAAERLDERTFEVGNLPLHGIVEDPKSERLAAYSDNRALIIWDNPAADVVPRVVNVPGIRGVALSPDGRTLAAALIVDRKSAVVLYNPDTGEFIRELCSCPGRIVGLAYAPHGRALVAGFDSESILILDATTGAATKVAGTAEGAHLFSFNAAGTLLAAARPPQPQDSDFGLLYGSNVFLIDVGSGLVTSTFRHGLAGWQTRDVAISSDGRLLAVSSTDENASLGQVVLWHIGTGRTMMKLRPLEFVPMRLAFLPGGESLAATTVQPGSHLNPGTFLWHLGPARRRPEFAEKLRTQDRLEQSIPPSGGPIGVRGPERHLWEQSLTATPTLVFRGHQRPVFSVAITADGQFAVSGDKDGVIKVWDATTGEERKSFAAHDGEVRALRFSPDGRYLASGGCFHFIRIWDVSDWSRFAEFDAHDGTVTSVDFSPDGERLVSGGRDGEIRCWDWRHATALSHEKLGDTVYRARFADAGKTIYSVHDKATLTRWDATSGRILHSEKMGSTGGNLLTMDLSPDSRFILGGGRAEEIRCYDTREQIQWAFSVGEDIYSSTFSSDGLHAALGDGKGVIYLLRFSAGSNRGVTFRRWTAHERGITDLRFSPDGKTLFSSSDDRAVKLWKLEDVPEE